MKYDIALCFVTPSGHRAAGFLFPEPVGDTTKEVVTEARDRIQASIDELTTLSIFTRDSQPIIGTGGNLSAMEVTLSGTLIKNSTLVTQIIEYPEDAA